MNKSSTAQFGGQRYTFLFKPGTYNDLWINLGFYTTVAGLGLNPDDVRLQNGALNVDSGWNLGDEKNATQNFWRSAENLSIVPNGGTDRWAVSQAAPMRRIHVLGNLTLGPSNMDGGQGYASGGYIADSKIDGQISSGLAAAVVHPRQQPGQLDGRRVEHGLLRRAGRPGCYHLPEPGLHGAADHACLA